MFTETQRQAAQMDGFLDPADSCDRDLRQDLTEMLAILDRHEGAFSIGYKLELVGRLVRNEPLDDMAPALKLAAE